MTNIESGLIFGGTSEICFFQTNGGVTAERQKKTLVFEVQIQKQNPLKRTVQADSQRLWEWTDLNRRSETQQIYSQNMTVAIISNSSVHAD